MSKVRSKKVVEAPVVEVPVVEQVVEVQVEEQANVSMRDQFDALIISRNESIKRLRDEIVALRRMSKQHLSELKNASKRRRRPVDPDAPRKETSFEKLRPVSETLCAFMGVKNGTLLAQKDVTKFIHNYINEHNLKNPNNGREFVPDAKLGELFGEARDVRDKEDPSKGKMYATLRVQTYLKPHYITV